MLIDLNPTELIAWKTIFNNYKYWIQRECDAENVGVNPCFGCRRVRCVLTEQYYTISDIALNGMDIVGTIPIELFQLENLRGLDISSNKLSGTLPPEIGNLPNLKALTLFLNELSGSIPKEIFNIISLEQISFYANRFNGTISSEISRLINLERIALDSNEFSGTIPPELSRLKNLTILFLDLNQLSGTIPPELSELHNLRELYLYENRLSGTIPPDLTRLENLEVLSGYANNFSGSIPLEIYALKNLEELSFSLNRLVGTIDSQIIQLMNLRELSLNSNFLNGTIPHQVFHLTNLTVLDLHLNQFSGTIHRDIGKLSNLQRLGLHSNQLSGTIPKEIAKLTRLERLDLHANNLSGTIPIEMETLTEIKLFSVHHNHLTGSIPIFLGVLQNLEVVDFSHNELSGSFPQEWNDRDLFWGYLNAKNSGRSLFFNSLRQLKGCCNALTGDLRDFVLPLLNVENLVQIDLSSNEISQSFSFLVWNGLWYHFSLRGFQQSGFASLAFLDLSSNQILGDIPPSLPSSLSIFFISQNRLTGSIPDSFQQLFVFLSKENALRSDRLPFFLRATLHSYIDLASEASNSTVDCMDLQTTDGSAKVFDIEPVYDHFIRCRCKAGYFNFQFNSQITEKSFVQCSPAPQGHYVPQRSRLEQSIPCPPGKFANGLASIRCEECVAGSFSLGGGWRCHPCLRRAICNSGVISLNRDKWMVAGSVLDERTSEEDIYDCLNNEACVVNRSSVRCASELGYDNSSVLCSECLEGFYSSDRIKKTCARCTHSNTIATLTIGGILLVVVITLSIKQLVAVQKMATTLKSFDSTPEKRKKAVNIQCLLRLLIDHIQILLILSDLQMRGPQLFNTILSSTAGSIIPSLSPAAIKCVFNIDFKTSIVIATVTPLILFAFLSLFVVVVALVLKTTMNIAMRSMFSVFVFLVYLVHPFIMKQLLQVFQFHNQNINGVWYLQSDMAITRYSPEYSVMFGIAIAGSIVYGIVFPLSTAISLQRRSHLKDNQGRSLLNEPVFEEGFGFLYLGYKTSDFLYLWELVIYFRKTILLFLSVFVGRDRFLQAYLAILVLVIAQTIHNKFHPYRSLRLNRIEMHSLGILGITQMCMLLSSQYSTEDVANFDYWITGLLVGMNAYYLFYIIWAITKELDIGHYILSKLKSVEQKKRTITRRMAVVLGSNQIFPSLQQNIQINWLPLISQANLIVDLLSRISENQDKHDELCELMATSANFLSEIKLLCETIVESRQCSRLNQLKYHQEQEAQPKFEKDFEKRIAEPIWPTTNLEAHPKHQRHAGYATCQVKPPKNSSKISGFTTALMSSSSCKNASCTGSKLHSLWHSLDCTQAIAPHYIQQQKAMHSYNEKGNTKSGVD